MLVVAIDPGCDREQRSIGRLEIALAQLEVTERLQQTVPVRVDAEDPGQGGPELAARYRISGYPVQLLINPEGGEVARADGYQTPGQFVGWLDAALDRYGSRNPPTTRKVDSR